MPECIDYIKPPISILLKMWNRRRMLRSGVSTPPLRMRKLAKGLITFAITLDVLRMSRPESAFVSTCHSQLLKGANPERNSALRTSLSLALTVTDVTDSGARHRSAVPRYLMTQTKMETDTGLPWITWNCFALFTVRSHATGMAALGSKYW